MMDCPSHVATIVFIPSYILMKYQTTFNVTFSSNNERQRERWTKVVSETLEVIQWNCKTRNKANWLSFTFSQENVESDDAATSDTET